MRPIRAVSILHVDYEGIGSIAQWFAKHRFGVREVHSYRGDEFPRPDTIDWVIAMGGPMGVHDIGEHPWLSAEKRFLERAIARGRVVIGICLGAQLLADVLGARVTRNHAAEIGWFPVRKTAAGKACRLADPFPEETTVLHWHGDTFGIPHGSANLFESEYCTNQMFTYGERVVGMQFHLETTPTSLADMLSGSGRLPESGPSTMNAAEIRRLSGYAASCGSYMDAMFDGILRSAAAGMVEAGAVVE